LVTLRVRPGARTCAARTENAGTGAFLIDWWGWPEHRGQRTEDRKQKTENRQSDF